MPHTFLALECVGRPWYWNVWELGGLLGVSASTMRLKPRGTPKGTVAGKIGNRRQIAALHF